MATEKILNTRIQLKYDSLENWASANTLLKAGEVAIAYLPPKGTGDAPAATSEAVLMKVGPGNFNSLPFVSALAADVYGWAKEASLTVNKDGTGNVVSGIEWDATANGGKGGIKFTTAAVATAEGLDELQKDVAALEKDIADNRDAWAKDDNTTYTFAKSDDGKGITITPSEGSANTITFAFLTQAEIEALNYLVAADITTGSANGTIAVEGTDVAVKGLQDAAYVTVDSLNATAKGYADAVQNSLGDLATKDNITASLVTDFATEVAKVKVADATHADAAGKVDNALTVKVGGTDVIFDGSAAKTADVDSAISTAIGDRTTYTNTEIDNKVGAVLGTSADTATANTVYGAKAAAAAAQSDATIAKTKIETFLGTVTPDGSDAIIDTLTEINNYVGEHGEEFAALSEKVTKIENGTTATTAGDLTVALEAEIKGYTVANATKAADADKLGGQEPSYYATATSVSDITKDGGAIDTKIAGKADKTTTVTGTGYLAGGGDLSADRTIDIADAVKTKIDNGATAYSWGDHAQEGYLKAGDITGKADKVSGATVGNFAGLDANGNLTDSGSKASDFATAAQGANADTAYGWGDHSQAGYAKAANLGDLAAKDVIDETDIAGTIAASKITDFATEVAAVKVNNASHADTVADHAIGAHQTKACKDYTGDDAEIWVFDCGSATVNV